MYQSDGLPNITGSINARFGGTIGVSGAFKNLRNPQSQGGGGSSYNTEYDFDASNSNPIYGNSYYVQPKSVSIIPILKY